MLLILDSQCPNPLFRALISDSAEHIYDLGTGTEEWALDVSDPFPKLTFHAVDLYPPP